MRFALCSLLLSAAVAIAQAPVPPVGASASIAPFSLVAPDASVASSASVATAAATLTVVMKTIGLPACPIAMAAQREASGQREWIVSLEDARRQTSAYENRQSSAGVHVELDAAKLERMVKAEVAVYYMAPGLQMLPAIQAITATSSLPHLKKTFVLSAGEIGSAGQLSGSLMIGRATSITRVRLLSVTFSDGHTWHPEANECNVTPSGLLLVSSSR